MLWLLASGCAHAPPASGVQQPVPPEFTGSLESPVTAGPCFANCAGGFNFIVGQAEENLKPIYTLELTSEPPDFIFWPRNQVLELHVWVSACHWQ